MLVEIHRVDVFGLDDDVDVVFLDFDEFVVEGAEGGFVDALLDRCNPHHGRVAIAVVRFLETSVVEIYSADLRG